MCSFFPFKIFLYVFYILTTDFCLNSEINMDGWMDGSVRLILS